MFIYQWRHYFHMHTQWCKSSRFIYAYTKKKVSDTRALLSILMPVDLDIVWIGF